MKTKLSKDVASTMLLFLVGVLIVSFAEYLEETIINSSYAQEDTIEDFIVEAVCPSSFAFCEFVSENLEPIKMVLLLTLIVALTCFLVFSFFRDGCHKQIAYNIREFFQEIKKNIYNKNNIFLSKKDEKLINDACLFYKNRLNKLASIEESKAKENKKIFIFFAGLFALYVLLFITVIYMSGIPSGTKLSSLFQLHIILIFVFSFAPLTYFLNMTVNYKKDFELKLKNNILLFLLSYFGKLDLCEDNNSYIVCDSLLMPYVLNVIDDTYTFHNEKTISGEYRKKELQFSSSKFGNCATLDLKRLFLTVLS